MIARSTRARLKRVRISGKALIPVLALAVGLAIGIVIGYALAPDTATNTASLSSTAGSRKTVVAPEENGSELEQMYDSSLELIDQDEKNGRLTKDKAQLVRGKLQALYEYKKTAGTTETREARSAKRQELRDWARGQDISTRYFVRLY